MHYWKSGIGKETAIRFAQEGAAAIVLVGRREERLNEVAQHIKQLKTGTKTLVYAGDVGSEDVNKAVVEAAVKNFGALHIAFNNAGIYRGGKPIWEADSKDFQEVFKTNVDSIFYALKYQIPAIAKNPNGGSIINNSSVVGLRATSYFGGGGSSYSASKFAVTGFTEAAAIEAAPLKVRVNAVAPGPTQTEIMGTGDAALAAYKAIAGISLLKRAAASVEVAVAVAFLASDESQYITGTSLLIDGGAFLR